MTKKYLIELKDNLHILTAEICERYEEEDSVRLLKPRDEDVFLVRTDDYKDFWLWLKNEKSFLPGESLDICFIYPQDITPKILIDNSKILNANISSQTEISTNDARVFFDITKRKLLKVTLEDTQMVLHLNNNDKLFVKNIEGNSLVNEPQKVDKSNHEHKSSATPPLRKSIRQRPKAFKIQQLQNESEDNPVITKNELSESPPASSIMSKNLRDNNSLPKATAKDIQIGIKRITEGQCQDVDFRD